LLLEFDVVLILLVLGGELLGDPFGVHDFVLLQVSVALEQVVLHLDVPLDVTDVALGIALCLLVVLLDLTLEPVLDALLQGLLLVLAFHADAFELAFQVMRALLFCIEECLVLCVGVLEVLQLVKVLAERDHLCISLGEVALLLLRDVLELLLVALAELALDQLRVKLKFLQLRLVSSYLLIFLIQKPLDGPRGLQEVFVVLPDLTVQLLLL